MFSDTPRSLRQGGSSFNERTCPMHTTTHSVEALSVTRVRFPCEKPVPLCPRVRQRGFDRVFPRCAPTVRWACALLRDSTLSIWEFLDTWTLVLSLKGHGYPKERFTLEPAKHDVVVTCALELFSL